MTYEQISSAYPPITKNSACAFVYSCVKCGGDTWRSGVYLEKDNAGTHTMCVKCYKELEVKP